MAKGRKTGGKRKTHRGRSELDSLVANDGGSWALLGYLYQFLGTAAYRMELLPEGTKNDSHGSMAMVRVEAEAKGQDVLSRSANEIRFLQFKFSQRNSHIAPAEFAEILRTFEKSTRSTDAQGRIIKWLLRTNRHLSKLSEALRDNRPNIKLGKTTKKDGKKIRECGAKVDLQVFDQHQFNDDLTAKAKCFGVVDLSKVGERVSAYLLRVIGNSEGKRVVHLDELNEVLAGFSKPRSLRAQDIAEFAKGDLLQIASDLQGTPLDKIIPRDEIQKLLTTPGIALAVVTGHGGCGKTRSVLKGLHEMLCRRACLVAALMPGPLPPPESICELVARWRCVDTVSQEPIEKSLDRIRIANEGKAPPVTQEDRADLIAHAGLGLTAEHRRPFVA